MRLVLLSCLLFEVVVVTACAEHREPPGGAVRDVAKRRVGSLGAGGAPEPVSPQSSAVAASDNEDSLPFVPTGEQLASTAWRTWIYTDRGRERSRLGYLRVGEIVAAQAAGSNAGCAEGWARVNPRGYVCLGKGATKDLKHPMVLAASQRATRGAGLPYLYALAADDPPHFFFQLPSAREIRRLEGVEPAVRFSNWKRQHVDAVPAVAQLLGEPGEPPEFLRNHGHIVKPYGVEHRLEFSSHSGRAAADSGFALTHRFAWDGRWYAVTTEHDIVALDRLKIVVESALVGIEIHEQGTLASAAFGVDNGATRSRLDAAGQLAPVGMVTRRSPVVLTGRSRPGGLLEVAGGDWVAAAGLRIIPARKEYPSFATGERKWIDISILNQTLVAYVGRHPVYATLVSTGRGALGDPETGFATPRGTFMVYAKHVSATMDGADDATDSYSLLDVPFVQYFHKGFALHGTYWHDEFGKMRSHGCVNLAPKDAAWLFEWTDPNVPPGWHGVLNKDRGTVVHIHP